MIYRLSPENSNYTTIFRVTNLYTNFANYFKLGPIKYSNSIAVLYHKDVAFSRVANAFIELALQTFKTHR